MQSPEAESNKSERIIAAHLEDLLANGKERTSAETELMRLLGLLIQDFDRCHAESEEWTGKAVARNTVISSRSLE